MKNKIIGIIVMILGISGISVCVAQDNSSQLVQQVINDNQKVVNAIALYPSGIRKEIFEASLYPEVIVKLTSMQKKTQKEFDELLSPLRQEEQEKIWNLTRYNGLISDLCASPNTSKEQISSILSRYPEEIRTSGIEEGMKQQELLCKINQSSTRYDAALDQMLNGYPPETDSIFRDMINYPEILTILSDNMQFTVLLGDAYKRNPKAILFKTDSLNIALAQKNAADVADWKKSLNDNPKLQEQYINAAKQYAEDNGYSPEDYSSPLYNYATDYYTYSYNWWFGYPYWYPYAYWDPYPYWYDWGFYFGPGNSIVMFGMPSYYFMQWFFYYPDHCYDYPELADNYYDYYLNHSNSRNNNAICREVDEWRENNSDIVNSTWNNANTDRTELFRQYGKMEAKRINYNRQNPGNEMERVEFIQKNPDKYPGLTMAIANQPVVHKESYTRYNNPDAMAPSKVPVVKAPDSYKIGGQNNQPAINNDVYKNTERPQNNFPQQKIPSARQEAPNSNQFRDAQQYHQNTWQQARPQQNYAPERYYENFRTSPGGGNGGRRK